MAEDKATLSLRSAETHIATTVGTLPAGIEWADGVTADTFATAYDTVSAAAVDGTTYTVEVVPAGTVYFIDTYGGASAQAATTEPYAAVAALLGDQLLNGAAEQLKTDDNTWGLLDADASGKGVTNIDVTDKAATGIYAKNNTIGETLSYALTLPAGEYTLTSYHREWWSNARTMAATLTIGDAVQDAGTVTLQGKAGATAQNTASFTVQEATTVVYTLTAKNAQAPVLSWLAVERTGDVTPPAFDGLEGKPLEDNDKITIRSGAALGADFDGAKQVEVTTGWISGGNSAVDGGAVITDAATYFKRDAFTLYVDMQTSLNEQKDTVGAVLIGTDKDHNLRLVPNSKDGTAYLEINNTTQLPLSAAVPNNAWSAVALVYEENETEGTVAVYADGAQLLAPTGIGFKLSELDDLTAGFGVTYATGFMRTGSYDNITVYAAAQDADTVNAATAARKTVLDAREGITGTVALNGTDVEAAAANVNGLTYKGLGMLNGNATSNLLLDYKAENPDAYWAMMEYLFGGEYPLFTSIKMEMGNDGNNSTGAEACTMRSADDEADASRSPGFVMAADAKKINPDIKVIILRWCYPAWISDTGFTDWDSNNQSGWDEMYTWYQQTIFDAYEKYGYVVDYVNPDRNETSNPNEGLIKYFADRLETETDFPAYFTAEAKAAYNSIRIVASDENKGLLIVPSMRADEELYKDVDAIGFHYRTSATDDYIAMADVDDKEVWYSEGCATFGYSELQENKTSTYGYESIGGYQSPLALADSLTTAFIGSRRTMYMFQPAIGSFYEGIQYGHKELLSARDPWSGYIHYDPALYVLSHLTKFAKTGWENDDNTAGIWRVITNATQASYVPSANEHETTGIDGSVSYMTLAAPDKSDFSVYFVNNTQNERTYRIKASDMALADNTLHVWTTETDSYLQQGADLTLEDGAATVTIPAYSVVTATTLETDPERTPTEKDTNNDGVPGVGDDTIQNETRTVLDTDATGKNADTSDEYLYADNFDYAEEGKLTQYNAATGTETEVDYLTARGNEPRYLLDTHSAWIVENGKLTQALDTRVEEWNEGEPATIVGDFRWMDYAASIDVEIPDAAAGTYARIGIRNQTGMYWNQSGYTLEINGAGSWKLFRVGTSVATGSVATNSEGKYTLKLMALGDTVYGFVDDVLVTTYRDASPMLSGRVYISSNWKKINFDNLEVKTVSGGIPYATAMIDGQDDAVSYTGAWTIDNPGSGSANDWYRTNSITSTAGASFSFDINGAGFALLGANSAGTQLKVTVDGIVEADAANTVATANRYESYSLTDLENGAHSVTVEVLSGSFKLDAIYTIGERLSSAADAVVAVLTEIPSIDVALTTYTVKGLPEEVEVQLQNGTTATKKVVWGATDLKAAAYSSTTITGTLEDAVNAAGLPVTVTATIGEVIPAGTVYFIDTVTANPAAVETTEPYTLYKSVLASQLLNEKNDQYKTSSNTWGLVDTDAGTKGYSDTTDKTATGIYGANNAAGETLTYALTLPAGDYTLTSAHREWWSMNRPMTAEVQDAAGNTLGTINTLGLSGSSGDIINTVDFTLDEAQCVTYTITATGTQAPVISWLAVEDHSKTAVNWQTLNEEITQAEALQKNLYTTATWAALQTALTAAKALPADADQAAVDAAAASLQQALEDLEKDTYLATVVGTVPTGIEWNDDVTPELFGTTYETVTATATDGTVYSVYVIPENLTYYVDAGTGADWTNPPAGGDKVKQVESLTYNAIAKLDSEALYNTVSDQIYNMSGRDNTWGAVVGVRTSNTAKTDPLRSPDGQTAASLADPYTVGLRTGNTSISYKLTLDAGTYTLTTGAKDWYGSRTRVFNPIITYTDAKGAEQTLTLDTINLPDETKTDRSFTLPAHTGVITLTYQKASGESPLFSWFAIAEQNSSVLRTELEALLAEIRQDVADRKAAGEVFAEDLTENTGSLVEAGNDSLQELELALSEGDALVQNTAATAAEIGACKEKLTDIWQNLRTIETYADIPGYAGTVIKDTEGKPMQAHGGSATTMKEGTGTGCVNYDLDGDGVITEGKTVYLWYGEDKTNNTHPVDGVRCYTSTDLYNWTDRGPVLYSQNSIVPFAIGDEAALACSNSTGSNGEGAALDYNAVVENTANLEQMKAWGRMDQAPEGVDETAFVQVKRFLKAYVTEFEVAPIDDEDNAWIAKSYDETPITATSFTYPDSNDASVRNQTTTRLALAFQALYGESNVIERPKMIYNQTTGKYVIVFHSDGPVYMNQTFCEWVENGCTGSNTASRYGRAMVGIATSDTPFGPFTLQNVTRLNYDTALNAARLGESRDMTVFVDDVDANNDGALDAYVIYSSEMNAKLYVSLLNADYTALADPTNENEGTSYATRIVSESSREAPSVFKFDGWYYLLTSGTDGWNSTAHTYYRSKSLLSGWELMGNPALSDTGKMFNSQVTYVLTVDAETGKFIYMGDRWNGSNLTDSRTIWLPLQVTSDNKISVLNRSNWTVDELDKLTPIRVLSDIPEVVWADGSNLPESIEVIYNGSKLTSEVNWTVKNLGNASVTGTLTACDDAEVAVTALVVPKNLVYIANPSGEASTDYTAMVEASKATLKHDATELGGAYTAESGFGYIGAAGNLRGNSDDIYQSLRYAANKTDSITYQFDLAAGEYEVYVGMYDPAGWASYNKERSADVKLNDTVVTEGYSYYENANGTADTLNYKNVIVGDDGTLTVEIAPNASTDSAVQVSFVMVSAVKLDPTSAPVITGFDESGIYCRDTVVTVTGADTVTLDGAPVTLTEGGSFTVTPGSAAQTIVATNKVGSTTMVFPKKTHIEIWVTDREPTTEAPGQKHKECAVCGEILEIVEIPQITVDPGTVETEVKVEDGTPAAALNNNVAELREKLMDAEDEQAIAKGKNVDIWIEIGTAKDVSAEDKAALEAAAGFHSGIEFLNIDLFKQVRGEAASKKQITETGFPLSITITIPENLRADGRVYSILRQHNGVSTVLTGSYNATDYTYTFYTDKFSTYAIAYADHSFGDWTDTGDGEHHQRVCACGEKETAPHTWNEGAITKAATATENGVKTYTCTVCGAVKTEVIPATGNGGTGNGTGDTGKADTNNDKPTTNTESNTTTQAATTPVAASNAVIPGTSDSQPLNLYIVLALVSAAALIGLAVYRKKKKGQ